MSEAAARAETAIKTGHGVEEAVKDLSTVLESVISELRKILPSNGGNGTQSERRDTTNVAEPLLRLRRLLEADDGEAAEFIVDIKPRLTGVLTAAEIKTLSDHIGSFDFDAALKSLSDIVSRLSINLEEQ